MYRFLLFLLRTVVSRRSRPGGWPGTTAGWPQPAAAGLTRTQLLPRAGQPAYPGRQPAPGPDGQPAGPAQPGYDPVLPGPGQPGPGGRRRWPVSPKIVGTAVVVAVVLIFRRAVAALLLAALSATLHLVGLNVHLPSVRFGWPWQSPAHSTAANIDLGPWVLQKIQGISHPALGQVNFNFVFTHRVSKNIGPFPCWYSSTFYAVGRASATVALNPGPAWWQPGTGHYRLQVLSRPADGRPGRVAVTMVLPSPQLPQSVHDVSIDNLPSRPVATQHSWTYPGFGCGLVVRPQFSPAVLYGQAQQVAFSRATHLPRVTQPLLAAARTEAAQTIRGSFIQPTVNALGYRLTAFTLRWAPVR